MKSAVDNKCPTCGANIKFNPTTQNWVCEYCGASYNVDDFERLQTKEENVSENTNTSITEYQCPDCGAIVITDENTVATHCVYCGNTAIMKNRLQGEFKPDKLIPFKSTKEEAIAAFQKNVKKKWFAPSTFHNKENIEKISGVYIPFWLYDSYIDGKIDAKTTKIRKWCSGNYDYTETTYYKCVRKGNLEITDLPVDGSTKFQDEIMDSIEPYDYNEFVPFNRSYLSGFLAEKYDLTSDDVYERAKQRMENTIIDQLKSTLSIYSTIDIEDKKINIQDKEVEYALLPVWMLNIKFNNKMYTFAMNGQTKKVIGQVPIDFKKLILKGLGFLGISTAVIFLIVSLIILAGGMV